MAEIDLSKPIVYRVEGMNHTATRRNEVYRVDGDEKLLMDLQLPPNLPSGARVPAIFFVHGGPLPREGVPPKQWGIFQSYSALAAASGFVGVAFNHRLHAPEDYPRSESDIAAAVEYVRSHADRLNVDPSRIALWYFSGGGPQLSWVLRERPTSVRCVLAFYALLDLRALVPPGAPPVFLEQAAAYSPAALVGTRAKGLPLFVARAGQDSPMVNQSIDAFMREAAAADVQIDFADHPEGRHTFDVLDDVERSREIIAQAMAFVRAHLS
ncbi:alpha/beta hydrolase [Corallococcus sp. EGB]|uniref:alpha/beta hydrolase n=1 Tax=Corallococcus sp. EGB TaxID=1521117 RepID=UPI001CC044BF|nr:alpha/beta hydrolase [Corallococcus sp. EGB]